MSARLGGRGAEAGVVTVPAHRRRGFAAAATAGWVALIAGRGLAPFYSTEAANLASQGVARRLGLTYLGATWSVS